MGIIFDIFFIFPALKLSYSISLLYLCDDITKNNIYKRRYSKNGKDMEMVWQE